jgi:hypothetical protein
MNEINEIKEYQVLNHRVRVRGTEQADMAAKAVALIQRNAAAMGINDYRESEKMLLLALKIATDKIESEEKCAKSLSSLEESVDSAITSIKDINQLFILPS